MPTFGRAMRSEWLLDPAVTYLNHGTVGATPRRVLAHHSQVVFDPPRSFEIFMLDEPL